MPAGRQYGRSCIIEGILLVRQRVGSEVVPLIGRQACCYYLMQSAISAASLLLFGGEGEKGPGGEVVLQMMIRWLIGGLVHIRE